MPSYEVRKSIEIAAPQQHVFDILIDYSQWPAWSPWLCAERDCKVTVHGNAGQPGHGQDWEGDVIGAGQMRLVSATEQQLAMDLKFLKPFKSQADIFFNLQAVDDNNTRVEWVMDSSLPFFLFFMTSNIKAMIGSDYQRGLLQLKDYIETGTAPTQSDVAGIVEVDPIHYLGSNGSAAMENIGDVLAEKFSGLMSTHASSEESASQAQAYTFYNKMNLKQQRCDFTAAIETDAAADAGEFTTGSHAACKALKIVHTGEYQHLGNAWATGMMHMRAKKMKALKNHPPFEKYINDPQTTPGSELVTEIYLPIK